MKRVARSTICLLLVWILVAGFAWAAAPEDSFVFSGQLSETEKQFYDEISLARNLATLRSGEQITLPEIRGSYTSESDLDAQIEAYMDYAINAAAVYQREHPELFWLNGTRVNASYAMVGSGYSLELKVGMYITSSWKSGGRSVSSDELTVYSAVQSLAKAARQQGNRYAQLLYVHDWLTMHNVYNRDAAASGDSYNSVPWTPLSALTDIDQPVCEGYARAFKLVCDELNIPCILIDGTADGEEHMWNYVQLDGKWYGVDVTWDDPTIAGVGSVVSGSEKHEYFLVGADTPVVGSTTFAQNHIPDFRWMASGTLSYPQLASTACPSEVADAPQSNPFVDVKADDYFAEAVQWALETGVTDGTSDTTFSPANTVKRGQAVTFLWRAMGKPEPKTGKNPFADVKETDYFYKAVLWAVENGITDGTTETTFSPVSDVTRGQMITFLWRTLGKPGETGTGAWNTDPENWGKANGYLSGTAEQYTTGAKCPRGDVVYYLWQAVA